MAETKYSLFKAVEEILKSVNGREINITTIMPDVNDEVVESKEDIRALRCNFSYAGNHTPDRIVIAPNFDRASQFTTVNLLHPDNADILAKVCKVKEITAETMSQNTNESLLDEICQAEWNSKVSTWWSAILDDIYNENSSLAVVPMMSGMIIGGYNGQGIIMIIPNNVGSAYVLGLDYNALINYHKTESHYDYYEFEVIATYLDGNDEDIPDGNFEDQAWFYGLRNSFGVEDAQNDGSKGMLILSLNQYNGIYNNFIANASPDYLIPDKYTQLFEKSTDASSPGGELIAGEPQLAP